MTDVTAKLAEALQALCNRIDFEGATPLGWPQYKAADEALAAYEQAQAATPAPAEPVGKLKSDPYSGHVFEPRVPGDWSMLGKELYIAPQTATPAPAPQLPQFIRAEVERAIAKAVAPTGMSTQDGMALIGHDKLRYMLALIDKLAATPAPRRDAAEATLQRLGYEWHGGELWKPPLGKAPAWAATPAPAPKPLTDAEIDMATDHLYCDGRPVPAKYRIALGRIVERLAGQGKEASK